MILQKPLFLAVAFLTLVALPVYAGRTVKCESGPHCGCDVKIVTKKIGECGPFNPELHVEITIQCPTQGATCVETFDVCGTDNKALTVKCAGKVFNVGPQSGTSGTWGGVHDEGRCGSLGVSCG